MPFENESYQTCIATEVLEHCPEPKIFLNEVHRALKKDGVLFFTVPFLWNLHETPHDEYRYTPFSLERILKECKFNNIEIWATGGWHASMAQMLGLWIRRSPMRHKKRLLLSGLVKPAIKYLIKLDKPEKVQFKNGQMITGLSGYVKK
jgi:SAM-dependent methyltransferase